MKQIKRNDKGFTLVELVVVIAILAVLAALLVPRILGNVEDARRSSALADARAIATEITTHNATAKAQTPEGESITGSGGEITSITDLRAIKRGVATGMGKDFPSSDYVLIKIDDKGNAYVEEVVEPSS